MKNNFLGWGLLITLGISFFMGLTGAQSEGFEIILGLFLFFFGVWGGIRLIKKQD